MDKFYNSELLRYGKREIEKSLKTIYEETGIAINTQQKMLKGENVEISILKKFADFLSVNWSSLFELDLLFACPGCGYLITKEMKKFARVSFPCPRCDSYCLNTFHKVEGLKNV